MGEPREQDKASSSQSRSAMTILSACVGADASSAPECEQATSVPEIETKICERGYVYGMSLIDSTAGRK